MCIMCVDHRAFMESVMIIITDSSYTPTQQEEPPRLDPVVAAGLPRPLQLGMLRPLPHRCHIVSMPLAVN